MKNYQVSSDQYKTWNIFYSIWDKGGGKRDLYEGESRRRNNEDDGFLFINGYYSVKNTYLTKFWNFHFTSTNAWKKILEARKRKFVLGLEKQH